MTRFASILKRTFVFLVGVSMFAMAGTEAMASHFRYGTISWRPTGTARQVEFRIKVSYRRTYTTSLGGPIGGTFQLDALDFGDGTGTVFPTFTITSFSDTDNYTIGEATVLHTYPTSPVTFTAFISSNARISNLNNGGDAPYRFETQVTPGSTNSSPVTSSPPIITVGASTTTRFVVPASDVDRDTLRFRLATVAEQGGFTNTQPPNFIVNSSTGEVTWNTATLNQTNFWTAQIMIEDLDSSGNAKSKTPIDFLLKIQNSVGSPPTIAINPPGPLSVRPNIPVTFTVTGNDPDPNSKVTLNASGLPTGSTMNPVLGSALTPPVTSTFSWTPTAAQAGSYTITFTATDDTFQQRAASINIFVEPNQAPTITCPQATTVSATSSAGASVPLSVQVRDPNGDALIVTWNVDGTNVRTDSVPASQSVTTVSLTRTYAVGTHNITVSVSDGQAAPVACTTTVTVNSLSISGRVVDGNNNGISGVVMTLTGSQTTSTTTDATGNYSLPNLQAGGNYIVSPSKAGLIFTPPNQTFNNVTASQTANFTGTSSVNITGRVTDGSNNGIAGILVVLSGTLTRVVQTDATGNYSFNNLVGGGNYSVIASSPLYVFTPPRFDFTNLSSNQIANFAQVPNAVPSPSPALVDDFGGAQRDPAKWNLGTATQPAGAFDAQVTVAQTSGQLVITPRSNASGLHYNGYTSVNAFNLTGGKASVEVAKAATGGADTIFAIGKDSNNFYRFMVHTAGLPSGLAPEVKNQNDLVAQADPTLLLQVVIAGQLTTLDVAYDPVQHHFMRFRHESAQVSPPSGAVVFEASPDDINYTPLRKTLLDRGLDPMTVELSAGTTGSTNTDAAKFDNVKLVLSTFQFSSGAYSVGEGDGSILVTVTRVGDTSTQGTVDFTTADGTAVQGTKYTRTTGKLTFAANETTKTFSVPIIDNILAEGNQTLDLLLSDATTAGLNSPGRAVLTIIDNETVLTASQAEIKTWTFQGTTSAYLKLLFPNAGYRVANWGQAVRSGNDFTADAVVEKLAGASVQSGTTTAGIYDLGPLAPGSYNFTFKNSGVVVKTLAFTVAAPPFPANPIDDARTFVKQQYRDFLNREADPAGEDFWTDNITKCSDPARRPPGQTEAQCTIRQRETTSGAFFQSPEFQYTGYYVLRMYKGALGRQPKLSEFTPDAQFVGAGILVNSQLSAAKINQNKADFAAQFVNCTDATKSRCAEFKTIYDGLNNQQYVDKLFQTTGINASSSDRATLVNGLNAIPATETRASVLQKVVDGVTVLGEGNQQFNTTFGQAFYTAESNRAFVQLEYFGYMKRDPDDAGYAFWLGKLNQFSGNFVNAEMVLAFISSPEYRARFGQP